LLEHVVERDESADNELKNTSTRSIAANILNNAWWLTAMMPIVKKLTA